MSSLQSIIRKKYLGFNRNSKKNSLPTDSEYQQVSECNLKDLTDVASTASILEEICEGEKCLTIEYYDDQEKKYHRYVAKMHRKVKEKPTLPRIVEGEVVVSTPAPTPAPVEHPPAEENVSDRIVAIPSLHEAVDAIRESSPTESRGQLQDPFQLAVEMPHPNPSTIAPDEDENFGSKDADGAREFLELCTGTDHPPMSLTDVSTQELVLAELGIPLLPLNDNFQEIDLRGINMPFLSKPLSASTPNVATTVSRRIEPPAQVAQTVVPIADPSVRSGDGQLLNELPEGTCSVDLAPVTNPNDVSNVTLPVGDIPHGVPATSEEIIHPQPTVQARGVITRSGSSSSVSTAEMPARVPRARRVIDFTRRLPRLADVWPPPRRSFDIFSYHNETNLFPMIDNVLNQLALLRQQPSEPLVDQLVMRATEVPIATGVSSIACRSNEQASRDPFATPAIEISDPVQSKAHPTELSQLLDSLGLAQPSGVVTNASTLNPLPTIDGKILDISDQYRLPSLVTDTPVTNETNVAVETPITIGADVVQGAATELIAPQEAALELDSGVGIPHEVINPDTIRDCSATAHMDSMLLDIFILVQSEMCLHEADEDFVPIQRVIQLLRITTRIGKAKLIKNAILLKQARLLVISRDEDNSILGVRTNFPTDLVDGSFS